MTPWESCPARLAADAVPRHGFRLAFPRSRGAKQLPAECLQRGSG